MGGVKLGYTAYQARTQWYINHWGPPTTVEEAVMEDGETRLGVMAFPPAGPGEGGRHWWTFATNGMSQRRMPCMEEPHGDPTHRLELITYASAPAAWVPKLLVEMARYPFQYRSGLAIGHTMPVDPKPGNLWSGYLLLRPRLEPSEFNPLGIESGLSGDWVFFAEVLGLQAHELQLAIELGGPEFARTVVPNEARALALDVRRASFLRGDA